MFWRRSRLKEKEEETDDLSKLQKQFGIKPISDADVQAEFQALFGGTNAASGLSPTEENLLFGVGDDEDDEEAKILRDLQLDGVNLDDDEMDEHQEAKSELRGVLEEAHKTAEKNHKRQNAEMSGGTQAQQPKEDDQSNTVVLTPQRAEQVRALKMEALTLKREGRIEEALAKFREAKRLQEKYSTLGSVQPARKDSLPNTQVKQQEQLPMDTVLDDGDQDVEVTEDDMQNPEFLAQLASMGLTENADDNGEAAATQYQDAMQQLPALMTQIHECKLQAVQFKRQNQIADALACMRKIKELEAKCEELRTSQAVFTPAVVVQKAMTQNIKEPVYCSTAVSASNVVRMNAGPLVGDYFESENDRDLDIEVTDKDMNDPAFTAELLSLDGADIPSTEVARADLMEVPEIVIRSSTSAPMSNISSSSRSLRNAPSFDEDYLIDAFDDKSSSEDEANHLSSVLSSGSMHSVPSLEVSEKIVENVTIKVNDQIADLTAQLLETKQTALTLKRKGDIQGALEAMRRVKQVQNLIDLKHHTSGQSAGLLTHHEDPARDAKFQEIEQLLIDFGNRAVLLAKNNLSVNREKASEWLSKRKRYGAELEKLRQRRQNSLQLPPPYEIVKTSHQVQHELPFIPDDQIRVSVKSVNGLAQVAGNSVFVKFCLNFPSALPHEGQTDVFQINSKAPFNTEIPSNQASFVLKLARSRGTLRLFEIKKAVFEVWKPGTLFRNPELVSRAYQELSPLLTCCEVKTHIPFLGPNRKPCGGDVEITLEIRRPLKEKEIRLETMEDLIIGEYPEPISLSLEYATMPSITLKPAPVETRDLVNKEVEVLVLEGSDDVRDEQIISAGSSAEEPHHIDLIISYDVMNEELEKVEAKLPSLTGTTAIEWSDRYDSLALKKQLLEIEMQTGKLTLDMYVERLKTRITADRVLIAQLLASDQRLDAARVLHRIKIMQKEMIGTEGDAEDE